jgi:hypothetical protein
VNTTYRDYRIACTVMIDDHWCRWAKKEGEGWILTSKKKEWKKRKRVCVCDDPKRPCVKEAMYAYAYILFRLAYAWLHNSIVVIRHPSFLFLASIHLSTIDHKSIIVNVYAIVHQLEISNIEFHVCTQLNTFLV